jgi:hypothetical protein
LSPTVALRPPTRLIYMRSEDGRGSTEAGYYLNREVQIF